MRKMEILQLNQTEPTVENNEITAVVELKPRIYSISYQFKLLFGGKLVGVISAPITPKIEKAITELVSSAMAQTIVVTICFLLASCGAWLCVASIKMILEMIKFFQNG